MIRKLLAFVALCVLAQALHAEAKPIRVLFVGNSLTYFNALPEMVADVAANSHPATRLEVEMLAAPGALIRGHLNEGHLDKVLAGGAFDRVVLQELGGFPACDDSFPGCRDSAAALDEAAALIKRHGARAILLATYQQALVQKQLSKASAEEAARLGVDYFDWGGAMVAVSTRDKFIELIAADAHPRPEGSWLAAIGLTPLITGASLPDQAPPRVCAPNWAHFEPHVTNSSLASKQKQPPVNCFELSDSTYLILKSAARSSTGKKP
jgi:hypothetical protein